MCLEPYPPHILKVKIHLDARNIRGAMTMRCSFGWRMVLVVVVFLVFLTYPATSQSQTNLLIQACSPISPGNVQSFFANLNETLRDIRRQLSTTNTYFATSELSRNTQPIYAMAQCRKYMSIRDCLGCFDFAASSIRSCGDANGARSVLDGCFLRYESAPFYNETLLPGNPGLCGNRTSSQQSIFETVVDGLLFSLSIATPKINGFYAATTAPIVGANTSAAYAIAQCVETLTQDECKSCLQVTYVDIRICISDFIDGRAVDSGCFMRYSDIAFFMNNQTTDLAPFLREETSSKSNKGAVVGGGVVGGIGGIIILVIVGLVRYRRFKRTTPGGILYDVTELQAGPKDYSYNDLKKATQDFTDENKLGEGGFGAVYKAILDHGEVVAVKKLKVGYGKAKVGFENEILLIGRIHHRNLLCLLGWSSEESNLLLVVEYMPNGSLDRFLWGEKRGTLSWKRRYDIILGIARGLTHLHKEFHVSIVHRDIKSSNILLDDDFQPKIADFGLARFQPEDQSHVITNFARTLGYTAPEYLLYGILSDKVDTFSFGIVILEIISGRKCTYRNFDGPSIDCLLEYAWKLYENKNLMKLSDETMDVNREEEKHIMKITEIALLCTQSPASSRPTMSEVVLMLANDPSFGQRHLARPNFTEYSRRILRVE